MATQLGTILTTIIIASFHLSQSLSAPTQNTISGSHTQSELIGTAERAFFPFYLCRLHSQQEERCVAYARCARVSVCDCVCSMRTIL